LYISRQNIKFKQFHIMKIIALSIFCLVSAAAISQEKEMKELKKVTINKGSNSQTAAPSQGVYYSDYVIYPEKLKTYFISGEIPQEFPKYDKLKSFEENKVIARTWAKANKELIKSDFWHLFENK
jgi:hypothetical protein